MKQRRTLRSWWKAAGRVGLLAVSAVFMLALGDRSASAAQDFSAIDAFAQSEMQATGLPGIALGIVHGDQIVHLKGMGVADPSGRAVTPQTPFIIGSMSKSFTALATMQLVEAGKLELDAPVQHYLPWFRVADAAASAQITVRHLLNQTSGMPTAAGLLYLLEKNTGADALEQEVRAMRTVELTAVPGQIHQYCNLNYTTLGLIIQTVTGESYEQYVQEHILAPLDMHNSFALPDDAQRHGLAMGYQFWFGRPVPTDLSYNRAALPAGYISASVEDMTHYLIPQINGGRYGATALLSPAGVTELHRRAAPFSDPYPFYSGSQYAMGWIASQTNGVPTVWHNGDTETFHAHVILVPQDQWGVVLLTNGQDNLQAARVERITVGIMSLLVGQQPPPMATEFLGILLFVALGVGVLQIIGVIRSIMLLRRWRAQPERRPRGALGVMLRVGLPLVLNLLWALVCLLFIPQQFESPLAVAVRSDVGLVIVVSGVFALVWGILRAGLVFLALRPPRMPKVASPQPA